ncbi:MAG TPA: TonB-dependent receptor [Rudaea sp.]|nr:TonB-dependent receptor [Rudaea sp.]
MVSSDHRLRTAVLVALSIGANVAFADASDNTEELNTIHVIAIAPEQGATLPENLVPYNVQSATSEDFERSQVLDVTDYLNRHAAGVTINSAQDNPLQPDVNFRGFTATPLLGGSEGISVYVDGVRVNEVFGDTVNWDLIPEEAMSRVTLLSGANPIFGLNSLGGSIQIQTKNGFTDPGNHFEAYAGSFGRSETTISSGANNGEWGYYVLANHFEEDGWRDLSNSNATSFLGTLSWRGADASFDLHVNHAETKLTGNGAQSIQVLELAPKSVFTAPDRTQNFYTGITANGMYKFNDDFSISATLFGRQVNSRSYNGDDTDFDTCDDNDEILCNDNGNPVLDQNGNAVPSSYNAINNIGVRKQRSVGGSLQVVWKQDWWNMKNQFVAGIDYDDGRVNYSSVLEASYLVPCPGDPNYCFVTAANTGVLIPDEALAVHISDVNQGIYFTDTLSVTDQLAFTLSGRYNHTHTVINDTSGENPDLDGNHSFNRFNPALGMTYQFSSAVNFYAGYNESTRAPTPVELTCASPDAPCKLPNDFVADPDLKQVVARSVEAGFRGVIDTSWQGAVHWQAGVFRTRNQNDIIFQATGGAQSNEGFYANVGDTRRQGFEASLNGKIFDSRLDWYANVAHVDATFQTPFTENSANNPNVDDDGLIQVNKGDTISGIPRNSAKIGLDYHVTTALSLGGDFVYNSSQYLRGDESNLLPQIGGYGVFNLRGSYRVTDHIALFARVENVFDKHYYNFGILGDATDIFPDFTDPRFLSPGMPRGEWAGVSIDF